MCLAIPMCIVEINGFVARCEAKGIERDVSLFMLQDDDIGVGDFVMVHVGYAIQKVSAADAQTSWELFDEALGLNETIDEGVVRHV
jgi:hydrogenase expression/formation protein HypC